MRLTWSEWGGGEGGGARASRARAPRSMAGGRLSCAGGRDGGAEPPSMEDSMRETERRG